MKAKFRGQCKRCNVLIKAGQNIKYDPKTKESFHVWCENKTKKKPGGSLVAQRPERGRVRHFTF